MKTTSWLDFGRISILGPRFLEQRLQFSPTVVFCVCNKIYSSAIWNSHAFVSRRGRSWGHLSHTCLSQMKKSRLKALEGMYISNMYIPPTVFFCLLKVSITAVQILYQDPVVRLCYIWSFLTYLNPHTIQARWEWCKSLRLCYPAPTPYPKCDKISQ